MFFFSDRQTTHAPLYTHEGNYMINLSWKQAIIRNHPVFVCSLKRLLNFSFEMGSSTQFFLKSKKKSFYFILYFSHHTKVIKWCFAAFLMSHCVVVQVDMINYALCQARLPGKSNREIFTSRVQPTNHQWWMSTRQNTKIVLICQTPSYLSQKTPNFISSFPKFLVIFIFYPSHYIHAFLFFICNATVQCYKQKMGLSW